MAENIDGKFTKIRQWYVGLALLLLNTALLLVVVNVGLHYYFRWRDRATLSRYSVVAKYPLPLKQIYPDLTEQEVEELITETRNRPLFYEEFTGFKERPFHGKFIHVTEQGYRLSKNQGPWPPDRENFNVVVLGGSTAFGWGVPDDQTVASYLQEQMGPIGGRRICVYNFGRGYYFSTQERILFEQLLAAGLKPDLAIFMDGLNEFNYDLIQPTPNVDLAAHFAQRAPSTTFVQLPMFRLAQSIKRRMSTTDNQAAGQNQPASAGAAGKPDDSKAAVIEAALDRYLANKKIIEAVASVHGVVAVFVWHPVPTYKYDLSLHPILNRPSDLPHDVADLFLRTQQGYPRAEQRAREENWGQNFIWCAGIQENASHPLYVDRWHFTAGFSQEIAGCIHQAIKERRLLPVEKH